MTAAVQTSRRRTARLTAVFVALLLLIMAVSVGRRLSIDVPNVLAGTLPQDAYDARFVEHHWLAYLHIGPGIVYLLGAPLQLSHRIRSRHYGLHRRLGRVLAGSALLSGVFALVFGILFPFGGIVEAAAVVVFGLWFLVCLTLAIRAIRRGDIDHHRRWMIRAFSVGVAVGTIRILNTIFVGFDILSFEDAFAVTFWISFSLHVAAAELWLRARPNPPELTQPTTPALSAT